MFSNLARGCTQLYYVLQAEAKTQASFNRPQTAAADLLSPRPEAMNAFIYESEVRILTVSMLFRTPNKLS